MNRSAERARTFVQQVAAAAERLAARDIVIASLECHWGSFGSWLLQAQRGAAADAYAAALNAKQWKTPGPDVLRASWDGKERLLTIESAPTPPLSAPRPWRRELDESFENSDAALRFVEEYFTRWGRTEPRE